MKIKVNWKELGRQLWAAIKPVLLGAIGGGLITYTTGCSSLTPSSKSQTQTVFAMGLPALAIVTSTTMSNANSGDDEQENDLTATNDVKPEIEFPLPLE